MNTMRFRIGTYASMNNIQNNIIIIIIFIMQSANRPQVTLASEHHRHGDIQTHTHTHNICF